MIRETLSMVIALVANFAGSTRSVRIRVAKVAVFKRALGHARCIKKTGNEIKRKGCFAEFFLYRPTRPDQVSAPPMAPPNAIAAAGIAAQRSQGVSQVMPGHAPCAFCNRNVPVHGLQLAIHIQVCNSLRFCCIYYSGLSFLFFMVIASFLNVS
jgi:hypothetical protein